MIQRLAPAKINLYLRSLGRRGDGFHDLDTVMVALDLADTVELAPHAELQLNSDTGLGLHEDLAGRAAVALRATLGDERLGASIRVHKKIPAGAGLGGGSSDAAAVLMGLNQLWGAGLSSDQLLPIAADLGSDVAFFLSGQACLAQGRGEQLTPLPTHPALSLYGLLLLIDEPVSTPEAYGWLDGDGLALDPDGGDRLQTLLSAWETGDSTAVLAQIYNSFTNPVSRRISSISEGLDFLAAQELCPLLCGSGSTVIGLSVDQQSVAQAANFAPVATCLVELQTQF